MFFIFMQSGVQQNPFGAGQPGSFSDALGGGTGGEPVYGQTFGTMLLLGVGT